MRYQMEDEFGFIAVPAFLLPWIEDWIESGGEFNFWIAMNRLIIGIRLNDEFVSFRASDLKLPLDAQNWYSN